MSGKSDGIWADLRKQRKIKYRDRDIMDHQHADFRGNSGVRFVCRLKEVHPRALLPVTNARNAGVFRIRQGAPVWSSGHLPGGRNT